MSSWRLVGAWVAALAVTTLLTWQIVSFADSQVSASPVEIAVVTGSSIDTTTTTVEVTTTSQMPESTTTSSVTTSSSSQVTSSSSAAATLEWSLRTVSTAGGSVVLRHRPDEVELQAATPAPGFDVEIDDAGPERVRVEFESSETDIRVEAMWDEGFLDVEVTEES